MCASAGDSHNSRGSSLVQRAQRRPQGAFMAAKYLTVNQDPWGPRPDGSNLRTSADTHAIALREARSRPQIRQAGRGCRAHPQIGAPHLPLPRSWESASPDWGLEPPAANPAGASTPRLMGGRPGRPGPHTGRPGVFPCCAIVPPSELPSSTGSSALQHHRPGSETTKPATSFGCRSWHSRPPISVFPEIEIQTIRTRRGAVTLRKRLTAATLSDPLDDPAR
jgi:hypothetical protein